jgi:demethylmenaquinone methyltransferase/2-methoxy-6-polyprenyl-1,4-benzoquinol methylase
MILAETIGVEGHVTGLDFYPELLAYGENLVAKAGLSERISFKEGNINQLPFAHNSFDWVWSADCIGYPLAELTPLLEELIRVIKPGGRIMLLGWTSQQVLPGYPFLEARLNGTCSGYLPHLKGKNPEHNFLRASHWMQAAGQEEVQALTFVGEVLAPLGEGVRAAITALFGMLWGNRTEEVSEEDWREYQRLCHPDSPDFILNLPGYYAFFTYTLFQGRVRL